MAPLVARKNNYRCLGSEPRFLKNASHGRPNRVVVRIVNRILLTTLGSFGDVHPYMAMELLRDGTK